MKARSCVHNDQKTLDQIKRKNEEIVNRLIKVKPFIRSTDQPKTYAHIQENAKRRNIRI